ncbi:MAG: NUDIX hydrolase [Ignavibacteriales bacterium]|nr:MAG: NUDIX hydrolase [Ignavibacteriales bacterium]
MKLEFNFNQSGVIPYRKKDKSIEILLITSMRKKKWIVPKGYVEFNLTPFESAKKEAYEEAGVVGSDDTVELGSFNLNKPIGICNIRIYSMEVIKVLEDYPDKNNRKRKWFSIEDAKEAVKILELSNMIAALPAAIKS